MSLLYHVTPYIVAYLCGVNSAIGQYPLAHDDATWCDWCDIFQHGLAWVLGMPKLVGLGPGFCTSQKWLKLINFLCDTKLLTFSWRFATLKLSFKPDVALTEHIRWNMSEFQSESIMIKTFYIFGLVLNVPRRVVVTRLCIRIHPSFEHAQERTPVTFNKLLHTHYCTHTIILFSFWFRSPASVKWMIHTHSCNRASSAQNKSDIFKIGWELSEIQSMHTFLLFCIRFNDPRVILFIGPKPVLHLIH